MDWGGDPPPAPLTGNERECSLRGWPTEKKINDKTHAINNATKVYRH